MRWEKIAAQIRWLVAALSLLTLTACDPGEVTNVDPIDPPETPAGDVVEISIVRPDGSPASDALLHYLQVLDLDYEWQSTRADQAGRVQLEGLNSGGLYWFAAEQNDPVSGVLGGGERRQLPTGNVEISIVLEEPRRQGIVISEVHMAILPTWETGNMPYDGGQYVEVFNNSDEVIYLDGMLIGKGYYYWRDSGRFGHHRCEDSEPMRNDPQGIWSPSIWRFPGAGGEHPLAPGQAALIARLASDHRDVHPTLLDLSSADFEFIMPGEADNPSAGNMIYLGPTGLGTWHEFSLVGSAWFVAAPTDVEGLPLADDPANLPHAYQPHRRVPAELIHDAAYLWYDNTGEYNTRGPAPVCTHPVHPSFDAVPGGFMRNPEKTASAQRRRVTVEGRSVLLDTNTSQIDFKRAERTPGWVP